MKIFKDKINKITYKISSKKLKNCPAKNLDELIENVQESISRYELELQRVDLDIPRRLTFQFCLSVSKFWLEVLTYGMHKS